MTILLSMVIFVGMLVEFVTVKEVVSTAFFLLLVISLVDVVGGFAVGTHPVQPNVIGNKTEHARSV